MFTVRIKPSAARLGGLYVERNFLYMEISLTKDLHGARIWGTYQQAERWSRNIDWRFTTADARIKLKRLYPSIQS